MEQTLAADVPDPEISIDHALMERVAAGDESAFRQIVERHQHSVVGTVTRMLGDCSDSDDIAQRVFIRIWKHAGRYQPDSRFTTYLYTIVRNLVYNESRRRRRKGTESTERREGERHLQHTGEAGTRPDNELLSSELRSALDTAISSLPENQRLAIVLRRYDNLPYEEIAGILNTSVSSVKSLLFRARTSLRESLATYLDP